MSDESKLPKVPPRPVRQVSSSLPRPVPRAAAPSIEELAPATPVPVSPLPESIPSPAPPENVSGLRVVTVAPGSISFPDTEEVTSSRLNKIRQDPYLGSTIDGRYKVEAVLGEGGMGVVYRCTHTIIGKKVAMKVLRADLARDAEVTERFLNEAKAASSIGNSHIIDISDFGQFADGATYFVMEFLVGQPLSKAIEGGRSMPVSRILHIARQLAEGLSAAHAANIVHRDLKPDNIFLITRGGERDFVKILDFGIAKVSSSGEGAKLTRAGAVFGTPHYMSPEQAAGQPVDHRGDVYSMGVILYELASGRVPFDADNFMGILTQHMYKAPVPIRALVPQPQEVPPGLEAIVLKCLSKRPEHRYQTMDELIQDLDRLHQGSVPEAVPEMMARSGGFNVPADYFNKKGSMPEPVPATPAPHTERSRWPLYAGLAGVAAAVAIVAGIFAKSNASSARPSMIAASAPTSTSEAAPANVTQPTLPAEPAPVTKSIAVAADPLDAHVFLNGEDLGAVPVVVPVEVGKTVAVTIRRDGYKEETLTLDGSKSSASVALKPVKSASYRAPVRRAEPKAEKTPVKKKPNLGGGEIVNPWD